MSLPGGARAAPAASAQLGAPDRREGHPCSGEIPADQTSGRPQTTRPRGLWPMAGGSTTPKPGSPTARPSLTPGAPTTSSAGRPETALAPAKQRCSRASPHKVWQHTLQLLRHETVPARARNAKTDTGDAWSTMASCCAPDRDAHACRCSQKHGFICRSPYPNHAEGFASIDGAADRRGRSPHGTGRLPRRSALVQEQQMVDGRHADFEFLSAMGTGSTKRSPAARCNTSNWLFRPAGPQPVQKHKFAMGSRREGTPHWAKEATPCKRMLCGLHR